jgi:predicted transcriptional regulator
MVETEKAEKKEAPLKTAEKQEEPILKKENPKEKQRMLFEIILHPKPSKLLTLLLQDKQWHTAALARESGQSYVYATELIKSFEKAGLISVSSPGRRKLVKLTEKGEKIAHSIDDILKLSSEEAAKPQQKTV